MKAKWSKQRDYYKEIDEALISYENNKPYHTRNIDWICNRIDWCWKFKHITEKQIEELANRACKVLERRY